MCCVLQLCQRSTVWQWRRVIVSWRSWILTRPTRCGWWLSTTQAALCPARDSTSELVSPHTGAEVTTVQQLCLIQLESIILISVILQYLHFRGSRKNLFYLLICCSLSGSSISASDWYRALYRHVGFSHAAVELSETDSWTELHLGVLSPVWTGGRRAQVGIPG